MKYLNENKSMVLVEGKSIPRGHRLWYELGIDKSEEAGEIEPYKTAEELIFEEIAQIESSSMAKRTERLQREARLGLDVTLPNGSTMAAADRLLQIDEETNLAIAELRKQL
jgi:hypothetical protein